MWGFDKKPHYGFQYEARDPTVVERRVTHDVCIDDARVNRVHCDSCPYRKIMRIKEKIVMLLT